VKELVGVVERYDAVRQWTAGEIHGQWYCHARVSLTLAQQKTERVFLLRKSDSCRFPVNQVLLIREVCLAHLGESSW